MRKIKLIAIILFGMTLSGCKPQVSVQPNTVEETMTQSEVFPSENQTEIADETMSDARGKYISFTPDLFNSSANSRRVLFFYANWCPTCKPVDVDFTEQMNLIPDDVTVIRVNYNDTETDQTEKDLAEEYGITYQHTFVQIDSQGNEVTKWNGGSIDELLDRLQ